ncbi:MAG: RNA-directed DNA polymerase [Candidatus Binatia bacterium]
MFHRDNKDVVYFVESDIANFYPSIRLEAIREHLHSNTTLDKEVVRLCVQIIDGVMPRQDYSEVSLMGLPQEQIGSSRAIAHSLLRHVDIEFDNEGNGGRYSRYMDDILIGVKNIEEGERCIARLQLRLEALGLYPNASKTMVVPVEGHFADAMEETNAEIERFTAELETYSSTEVPHVPITPHELLNEISEFSLEFRNMNERPRRWTSVMRRIYTLQRRAGLDDWWEFWRDDVERDPGSAGAIFEYVRSWPLTERTVTGLIQLSSKYCQLYADVSILAAESIVTAPVAADHELWMRIHRACQAEFTRLLNLEPQTPEIERIAAAWLVSAWKFGDASQYDEILSQIPRGADSMSPVRAQALPLLVCAGHSLSEWVAAKPGLAWEDALAAEYLRSLHEGEGRAVGVALSLITPQLRLAPQRFTILPRALPLIVILGQLEGTVIK